MSKVWVTGFHDEATGTITYVAADRTRECAAVIDPVWDFEPKSARLSTSSVDRLSSFIEREQLTLEWILETHVHADHLTAAQLLKHRFGAPIAIGVNVSTVQRTFAALYGIEAEVRMDGSQFDRLFGDGDRFFIGGIEASVLYTPGHTPACITYVVGDAAFVGDTLFMPDSGTARCDFPGGDARTLFRSIGRILDLSPDTRIFVGHDYGGNGREPAWEATVADQQANNIHVGAGRGEDAFVHLREERDRTLEAPTLILPALQVNIRAGMLPAPEANETVYLKLPLNRL
ncbi:MAG TPA: MBL fold metallo-hydrolase [Alphaproteobacteria bacterium]|nr:MBL fold metallo-hydrolase [Steroidobacteraceae bacterium]HXV22714.1 MBL fold metallo-hydrolase [Alphaproteobacteria bacterium]